MNVYIVQCNQYFKVGKADDVRVRLSGLQSGCPYKITVIATLETTQNAVITEKRIHKYLSDYRVRGEWFLLSVEQVEKLIKKYKFVRSINDFSDTEEEPKRIKDKEAISKIKEEAKNKTIEREKELKAEFEEWKSHYKHRLLNLITSATEKSEMWLNV